MAVPVWEGYVTTATVLIDNVANGGTSFTLSTADVGDIRVIFFHQNRQHSGGNTFSRNNDLYQHGELKLPSGWNWIPWLDPEMSDGSNTKLCEQRGMWRIKESGDSDSITLQVEVDTNQYSRIFCFTVSGVDANDPIDSVAAYKSQCNAASTTTLTNDGITTQSNDCLIVSFCASHQTQTYTCPSGFTERFDPGADECIEIATKDQSTAGSTGALTWTASNDFYRGGSQTDTAFFYLALAASRTPSSTFVMLPSRFHSVSTSVRMTAYNSANSPQPTEGQPAATFFTGGDIFKSPVVTLRDWDTLGGQDQRPMNLVNSSFESAKTMYGIPSDFASMSSGNIRVSAREWVLVDDIIPVGIRIWKQGGTQLLAGGGGANNNYQAIWIYNGTDFSSTSWDNGGSYYSNGPGVAPTENMVVSFGYIDTAASLSDWENATIDFKIIQNNSMAADGAYYLFSGFQFEMTYVASSPPTLTGYWGMERV